MFYPHVPDIQLSVHLSPVGSGFLLPTGGGAMVQPPDGDTVLVLYPWYEEFHREVKRPKRGWEVLRETIQNLECLLALLFLLTDVDIHPYTRLGVRGHLVYVLEIFPGLYRGYEL